MSTECRLTGWNGYLATLPRVEQPIESQARYFLEGESFDEFFTHLPLPGDSRSTVMFNLNMKSFPIFDVVLPNANGGVQGMHFPQPLLSCLHQWRAMSAMQVTAMYFETWYARCL